MNPGTKKGWVKLGARVRRSPILPGRAADSCGQSGPSGERGLREFPKTIRDNQRLPMTSFSQHKGVNLFKDGPPASQP